MESNTPGTWYQLGIVLRNADDLIGDCGVRVLETESRQAEIGITLAPAYQGHGYATEAMKSIFDYLLVRLGKHRVFTSVDPCNQRSMALMQRLGMRKEAHLVESLWFKDQWADDVIFAMLQREWKSARVGN